MHFGLVLTLTAGLGLSGCANSVPQTSRDAPHGCSAAWDPANAPESTVPLVESFGFSKSIQVIDSFDGPAGSPPDPDTWRVIEGTGWDRGTQDYARENAVLDGAGHLVLQAQKAQSGYTGGRVETRRKASFGYGTLIARIKMPAGVGLWPAFWLMGADEDTNPWPGAGEIDVVEVVSDPKTAYSSIHGPISGVPDYLQKQFINAGPDLSAGFHDYWVIRAENKITVGIDDTVWGVFTPDGLPPTAEWVYNKPFCLILNLAVGGEWAGPPDESTPFPATMLVDWVHWEPA
jgi:beta-glucanase (GH16 family)